MCTGGAVVKAWAAEPKDVGLPLACVLLFIKSCTVTSPEALFRQHDWMTQY